MKRIFWMVLAAALSTSLVNLTVCAQAQAADTGSATPSAAKRTGVIKEDRVNVRGKATLKGDLVTQLNQGDRVTVLEEITLKSPAAGEPEKWLRIALPSSLSVWVHGSFIDPVSKAVTGSLLNLRSGPGENYSVLGQIPKGAVVKPIEEKGNWQRIEAPDTAYAYVAAFLVNLEPAQPAAATAATPPPAITASPTQPTQPPVTPPAPAPEVVSAPPPIKPEPVPVESVETTPVLEPAAVPEVVAPPAEGEPEVAVVMPEGVVLGEETEEEIPPPPPKRIVRREGIVRRSLSIQAPSEWILQNVDNRRTMNYLHSPTNSGIILQDYYGKRVFVTGEELLEERWLKTPVLSIDTLEPVP